MPTILLADDDVTLMERLATLLGNEGYTVLRANQVQYAELMLREQSFDLILLDPDMGRGDGWVLMGAAVASTPVIVISGQGLEEDIVRGLDAGAADYLAKPFGTAELLARMRTRLRERERSAMPVAAAAEMAAPANEPAAPRAAPAPAPLSPASSRRRDLRAPGDEEGEPVFMSYGEEGRLVRDARSEDAVDMGDIGQLPLGQRLHAARMRKRLTRDRVARQARDLPRNGVRDPIEQIRVRTHQQHLRVAAVFGLREQIGGDEVGVGCLVGNHQDF